MNDYRSIRRRELLFSEARPTRDRHKLELVGGGQFFIRGEGGEPGLTFGTEFLELPTLTYGAYDLREDAAQGVFVAASVTRYYGGPFIHGCDLVITLESYDRQAITTVTLTFEGKATKFTNPRNTIDSSTIA